MCFSFPHVSVHSTSIYFALGTKLGSGGPGVSKDDRFLSFPDLSIRKEKNMLKNVETGWHPGETVDGFTRQIPVGFGGTFY